MMRDFSEELNINSEDAVNVAESYEGYARALYENDLYNNLPLVASSFLISALYSSIFDTHKAKGLFVLAADCFLEMQSPLWYLCEICGQSEKRVGYATKYYENEYEDPEQFFFNLLWQYNSKAAFGLGSHFDLNKDVSFVLTEWLPSLNIPYRLVIDTIDEVQINLRESKKESLINFSKLILRLEELVGIYRIDEYRWKNVEGPILPFEPAALAIMVVLVKIWQRNNSYEELVNILNKAKSKEIVLLRIAHQLLNEDDKFEGN